MKKRALTLIEILTVITILAILVAILIPVITTAKLSAKKTVCANQLRQVGVALQLYSDDANGEYPVQLSTFSGTIIRSVDPLVTYGTKSIMRCPLDKPLGRGRQLGNELLIPRSYSFNWILWEGESGVDAWQTLLQLDSNPVVARCNFHEQRVASFLTSAGHQSAFGSFENGYGLVLRRDLSVSLDKRSTPSKNIPGSNSVDLHLNKWVVTTNIPCPADICKGDNLSKSVRED